MLVWMLAWMLVWMTVRMLVWMIVQKQMQMPATIHYIAGLNDSSNAS
jgi:hypothetical protein